MPFFNKTTILAVIFLFGQYIVSAQGTKDEIPPPDFISELENLPPATLQDIADSNLVLFVGPKKYSLPNFRLSRAVEGRLSGFGEDVKKTNELIDIKETAKYKLLALISSLRDTATYLCRKDLSFSPDQPLQHKIVYSWGSKDYKKRGTPPGSGDNCKYKINGLDCSGFIYQLFYSNGVPLPAGKCNAENERTPSFLKKYLIQYFGSSKFEVKDIGQPKIDEIQSGDIIYFKKQGGSAYHIGIFFVSDAGKVTLYQSLGQPNRERDNTKICDTNLDDDHGPIIKEITKQFLEKYNNSFGCVRIIGVDLK